MYTTTVPTPTTKDAIMAHLHVDDDTPAPRAQWVNHMVRYTNQPLPNTAY